MLTIFCSLGSDELVVLNTLQPNGYSLSPQLAFPTARFDSLIAHVFTPPYFDSESPPRP